MDFEDSGIESDPKANTSDTNTLKQSNEPIISFSPQRGRFDSVPSNSRKSSTSYPISVADLQLDDPPVNSSSNAPSQQNLQQTTSSANNVNSNSIKNLFNSCPNNVLQKGIAIHQVGQQQPHFTNVHNNFAQNQAPQQPYPFLHNQFQSNSSSSPSALHEPLTINTSSSASSTLNLTSSTAHTLTTAIKTCTGAPLHAHTANSQASSTNNNSIPLMVNGALSSANNNASSTNILDLQKRLERRIAQASSAASSATSPASKTKANDSLLSDILASSSKSGIAKNDAIVDTNGCNGNQISFPSQSTASSSYQQRMLGSLSSSLWETEPSVSEIEDLLWESKSVPPPTASNAEESSSKDVIKNLMDTSFQPTNQVKNGDVSIVQSNNDSKSTYELASTPKCSETAHGKQSPKKNSEVCPNSSNNSNPKVKGTSSNKSSVSKSGQNARGGSSSSNSSSSMTQNHGAFVTASTNPSASSSSTSVIVVNSGFDIRKVSALLPPQRLAIPSKQSASQPSSRTTITTNNGKPTDDNNETETTVTFPTSSYSNTATAGIHKTSTRSASVSETSCNEGNVSGTNSVLKGNGNVKIGSNSSKLSSEKKPLVQWDSDESEEELSFFPPAKRGVITDNLSIDNMSLSGEEEDLHLTPPRPLAKKCPCDPRSWLDKNDIASSHHHHGDPSHSITSKPCIIS